MEEHSSVDISIRNVAVRLNDSNVGGSEMNGECVNIYIPTSGESETAVTHFNENCEENCAITSSDISDEVREKLRVSRDRSGSCGLLNGCNKLIHDEMKCVDFSVNGMRMCSNFERINAHIDQMNNRTCIESTTDNRTDIQRTESESIQDSLKKSGDSSQNTLSSNVSPTEKKYCSDTLNDNSEVLSDKNVHEISNISSGSDVENDVSITYLGYESESQMPDIMRLIQKDLSEPYSIYTYRYFIHNWPKLCFLAQHGDRCVGAIVCKLDVHKKHSRRGYIAMLAVDENYRKRKIGSNLVLKAIHAMVQDNADEVVLETEITNKPALRLYENL
ncbi:N-alpha-acetyltransferase 30, partial [Stegodyphus mimosarum]